MKENLRDWLFRLDESRMSCGPALSPFAPADRGEGQPGGSGAGARLRRPSRRRERPGGPRHHATPTITLNTYVGEWPDTDQETSAIVDEVLGQVPRMCPPAGQLG